MGIRLCCVIMFSAFLAGCGGKPRAPISGSDSARPPISQTTSDEFHHDDPCALLEPKEVEAVLGAPLGTPPYRAHNTTPGADGPDCVYVTANFHEITLTVDFTDGAQSYRMTGFAKKLLGGAPSAAAKKALTLDDGTELTGEWDEAQLTALNCCLFNALRADQMISIDFTGSDATLRQAASLVDAAFKRIDKPLKLDGAANVAAAQAFAKTRPMQADPCALVSRSEAEAILGPLVSAPAPGGTASCSYEVPRENGIRRVYELDYTWRGGYAENRGMAHTVRITGMAMGGAATDADDQPLAAGSADDPWERAGVSYNDFVALKKDVRVKIDRRTLDPDKVKALVGAAMRKI